MSNIEFTVLVGMYVIVYMCMVIIASYIINEIYNILKYDK